MIALERDDYFKFVWASFFKRISQNRRTFRANVIIIKLYGVIINTIIV